MITVDLLVIVLFLLSLGMWQSYKTGVKSGQLEGINASLDHLIEEGRLDVIDSDA